MSFNLGEWNAICDVCGWKYKSSQLRKRWDGFMVCERDYEERHPMDYYRGPRPEIAIPWSRPEATDRFVSVNYNATNLLNLLGVSGDYASTPDSSALDIVGDIDIIVYALAINWANGINQMMVAKSNSGTGNRSYQFFVNTTGFPMINTSVDGTTSLATTSTAAVPFANGVGGWLRVTRVINDGAGNHVDKFYYSNNPPTTSLSLVAWTQLGSVRTVAGTTSIFAGNSPGEVGTSNLGTANFFTGKIYSAYIYSGVGGTLVASMVAPDTTTGSTSWTSSLTGETWTLHGNAAISNVGNQGGFIPPTTLNGTL